MKKLILLAGGLCLGSVPAMAADAGLYFELGLGQSIIHDNSKNDFDAGLSLRGASIQSSSLDDQGSSWSVAVGYRVSRYFAADLSYLELGAIKYRANITVGGPPLLYKASVSASGPAVAVMGILPLGNRFELRGRVGVIFAKTTFKEYESAFDNSFASDTDSKNPFAGVSAAFNVTDTFAVHVGAQRFSKVGNKDEIGESDVDVFGLGITFSQ